jgi:hypothetical protein
MRVSYPCLLLGVFTCLVSPVLVYLTHAWVFVIRGVHAHARELRVPAFGCTFELDVTCACFPVHAWMFVLRGVHNHAHVLRVPAFGCLHMLGVTCACFLVVRAGVCAKESTRACACCARACSCYA